MANTKLLKKHIIFRGYINGHDNLEKLLVNSGVGLAPYKPEKNSYSFYADPAKIKQYLGCGIPIITTSVPPIAKKIKKYKAGEVITYSQSSLIGALKKMLESEKSYMNYKNSSIQLAKQYDMNIIYQNAFEKLT